MKKYNNYKNSGVEWLGEIPEHWETKRIKHLFKIGRGRVIAQTELLDNGIYPVYSSQTQDNGILGYINTYDFDCTQITWTTDGANAGTIFLRKGKHNCTNVCGTLQQVTQNQLVEFILFSLQISSKYYKRPDTNGAKIMNGEMGEIFITLPPLEEQTAIANFLDDKTTKIDQAIAIKQKQIELLKERRQILIHKAVTRGLNDKVKLKDSGVEWIGEIPEHWEVKRLKYVANIVLGKMLCNEDKGNYKLKPYLKSKNIQWLNVEIESVDEMWFSEKEMLDYRLKKGDLILSEGGEVGKTCIWNNELEECYIQNSAHKVTVYDENISEYYLYIFYTIGKFGVFDSIVNRVSIGHLTKDKLSNIEIINPPKEEQTQIAEFIETATTKIATAISLKEQEIEKLKEYKMSLIDGVVTGKVKVC